MNSAPKKLARTANLGRRRIVKLRREPRPKPSSDGKRELDPWRLVWGQPYIDSETLATAIEQDLQRNPNPDFRTRLLVRDAARAIKSFWGPRRFAQWTRQSSAGPWIKTILKEELGRPGFHNIKGRLVANIGATEIRQIFDLLGQKVRGHVDIYIAGSIPTLLKGLTARPTDDIDIVDEVPAAIRRQTDLLDQIRADFGLKLGHVQSHYFPANWMQRRQFLEEFGGLRVYLVDSYDIFVSKLSSKQEKHIQDLRVLAKILDKETARRRLLNEGKAFLDDPHLRPQIEANWRFIYQQPLLLGSVEKGAKEKSKQKKSRKRPGPRKRKQQ